MDVCSIVTEWVIEKFSYCAAKFAAAVQELLGCPVEIAKRNALRSFAVIPKRGVVERSYA
jgi:hypothetical protein